jgi:hypothetical protein
VIISGFLVVVVAAAAAPGLVHFFLSILICHLYYSTVGPVGRDVLSRPSQDKWNIEVESTHIYCLWMGLVAFKTHGFSMLR